MKKNSFYLMILLGFAAISLLGSEKLSEIAINTSVQNFNKDPEIENILAEVESHTDSNNLKFYFPSYITDRSFYEEAYKKAGDTDDFDENVSAAILPHHLVFPEKIAGFFEKLSEAEDVETVFLIGPNHSYKGKNFISISKYGYSTPYGNLDVDSFKVDKLLGLKVGYLGFDQEAFDGEHSISSLVPFIKKSFPSAKIVPIVIKGHSQDSYVDRLSKAISTIAGPKDIVIGSIDFSHYLPLDVANFHDETARSVIEDFDFDNLGKLEIDSLPSLRTVMQFAYDDGAQDVEIVDHSNSAEQNTSTLGAPETTSHFYIAFKNGDGASDSRAFSLLAVGDIMLGRFVRIQSERNGSIEYPFGLIRGKDNRFFNGFDLLFGNLEGPIYKQGVRSETSMVFGFNEDTAPVLRTFGFDVMSVANNHTLNQRNEGFDSTITKLTENDIDACGHPNNIGEESVAYKEAGDKKLAFICFEDAVTRLNKDKAVELIKTVHNKADFIIVSPHFGTEYKHSPNQRQVDLAHAFVDAGADIVIGTHPHVVEGFEIYNGIPIFYSLGNFIFDQYWSYDTQEELALGINVSDKYYRIYLFPMLSQKSQPYLMPLSKKTEFFEKFIKWGNYDDYTASQIRNGVIEIQR